MYFNNQSGLFVWCGTLNMNLEETLPSNEFQSMLSNWGHNSLSPTVWRPDNKSSILHMNFWHQNSCQKFYTWIFGAKIAVKKQQPPDQRENAA